MSSSYNSIHWNEKIQDYLKAGWSKQASPFVRLAKPYFKPAGAVLELGTGAGQDGLWLESQGFNVTFSDGDDGAFAAIQAKSSHNTLPIQFDITNPFPFADDSFDVVYAQLVLHYFDDETMLKIMKEVERVLAPGGVLACMVNTVEDEEYKNIPNDGSGLLKTDKLLKRYFSVETLSPFVKNFKPLVFDAKGRTPKDDAVGNSGMIQFIGSKND